MSTLLTDLDSSPPVSSKDGDLVAQILNEMNGPPLPPPSPANPPNNTAVNSYTMGTNPATAHVIGGAHPTPADFAAAMHGVPQSSSMYAEAPAPAAPVLAPRPYKKSYTQRLGDEFKIPLMVSILFFVFSLPVINLIFARYVPWTVMSTGQLTTIGLALKSLSVGSTFWILQRVVVPLFTS